MSSLTALEKRRFEKLFDMSSGYVLDFSNRTFHEFIVDVTDLDIYDPKYDYASGSKANRLRAFWTHEPDEVVAQLLRALLEVAKEMKRDAREIEECERILERLRSSGVIQDRDAIRPNADGRDFEALATTVRKCIDNNEPEIGLDRLHTYMVRYSRVLCEREGIDTSAGKPLHNLFGELLRAYKQRGLIESEMTERILKSTISILDAFNDVRNNRSFAHDNALLSYDEAQLIFANVASTVKFLSRIAHTDDG